MEVRAPETRLAPHGRRRFDADQPPAMTSRGVTIFRSRAFDQMFAKEFHDGRIQLFVEGSAVETVIVDADADRRFAPQAVR